MSERRNRVVIAGTSSGAGKTTVTVGIMAALKRRGLAVQGFKCGPDYIDPSYHTAVTGRRSRNVDTWMVSHDAMRETFLRGSDGADVSVIEGVMGLYDGKDPLSDAGSTAEIAILLECPVILVVNVQSMARSAAAVVLGYQSLNRRVRIAGVIPNKCGSGSHYRLVKSAIEQQCGIPVLGWLGRDDELHMPERHLGLVPAVERGELNPLFERLADRMEYGADLDALLRIANEAPQLTWPQRRLFQEINPICADSPVIAVARDAAFNFYYVENLEMLERFGAELVYFSPLAGEKVPSNADGVYIGGGFPEEFAAELAANEAVKEDLRRRALAGLPVFAECGGYMYLARAITDRAGNQFEMAGIIPANVTVRHKLSALGYREAKALRDCLLLREGETVRGHEFHYSVMEPLDGGSFPYIYETAGLRGTKPDGYSSSNIMAGYIHIHFSSNPNAAKRFLAKCMEYRKGLEYQS
ncbi:cobyrinate a,c-diamide synthase [Paenibacillus alkalitolerans]|uniref:cobyrinate a,c-diamide synthase n=1 Tax=Paenibacillus alkalitolerans TaxID=2799335 RepID=UPI0018F47479|nr:cobyrinate a,c-diamide synthase [Paenibacillus alkalitolerans]